MRHAVRALASSPSSHLGRFGGADVLMPTPLMPTPDPLRWVIALMRNTTPDSRPWPADCQPRPWPARYRLLTPTRSEKLVTETRARGGMRVRLKSYSEDKDSYYFNKKVRTSEHARADGWVPPAGPLCAAKNGARVQVQSRVPEHTHWGQWLPRV